ncbi:MAG: polymerase subunit sigma, partial [Frankiales bacterium]|nr:polymerase subunit sigma [Frankiales bacterium]
MGQAVTDPAARDGDAADLLLWARARAGDAGAFGELFDRHAKAVYNFCFRLTADWSAAEDLMSATFVQAWRRSGTVPLEGAVLPWLLGVARNVCLNHHRSLRRRAAAL